ncbi:PC4 and SFRS1-interacting protein-like [Denticeps clupeoides]|uniref:PC4 and SFRS1-interacting protein-like n=1 Tax=Denticeps clupeoides TaxID=299321 RepID=UPI0010A4FD52|nr:PC4 and SFRS1-interacting protein-like [Denticeps clupeoides]
MKAAQGPELRPGDAVFAKMKSRGRKRPGNKVPVFFYGTHQTAFLEPKDVVPYWPNKEKYGKPYKKGGFQKAMWEIEHDPGVGLKGQKAQSEEQKDASSVPPAPAGEEQEGGGEDGKVLLKRRGRISAEDRQTVLRCLQGLVQADRENRRERQQQEGEEEEEEERKMPECVKKEERKENKVERKSGIKIVTDSVTDSRLHRLLGEIRVSLTVDNPDVAKCVLALDELGRVPVSSQNLQNHRELIDTLRKIRKFGGSEVVMQKASMLYYKFKSVFLDGEAEDEELAEPAVPSTALQEEEQQHAASGLGDQQLP